MESLNGRQRIILSAALSYLLSNLDDFHEAFENEDGKFEFRDTNQGEFTELELGQIDAILAEAS